VRIGTTLYVFTPPSQAAHCHGAAAQAFDRKASASTRVSMPGVDSPTAYR
jgi:hypothetical protein